MAAITGGTANAAALLASPPTVTTTSPVVAPPGTETTILVRLQDVTAALTPSNVTVLVPCVSPKAAPSIVTSVPTGPQAGDRAEMLGATLNATALLGSPPTVTTTGPVDAGAGTGTVMADALHAAG